MTNRALQSANPAIRNHSVHPAARVGGTKTRRHPVRAAAAKIIWRGGESVTRFPRGIHRSTTTGTFQKGISMRRTAFVSVIGVAFASTAFAADLPPRSSYKAPYPMAVTAYNWTGFYVGGHFGYGWSTLTGTDPTDGTVSDGKLKGILGGAQLGYNYQIGSIVLGVEGDFSFSDVKNVDNNPFG